MIIFVSLHEPTSRHRRDTLRVCVHAGGDNTRRLRATASLGAEVVKKHFVKNVDALGEHHGAVYLPTQLYKESSDPHALIEARRKSSEPASVKKGRKPAAKKPARKPAAKRARDSSDDSSDGEVIHATSAADRAARRKSSNESVRRAAQKNQVPVREFDKENSSTA